MNGKKITITGAQGFIGSHLVRHFLEQGDEVIAIAKGKKEREKKGSLTLAYSDIASPMNYLGDTVEGSDCIYHLAALPNITECVQHPRKCFHINALGTVNALELARIASVKKFVFVSSSAVYGNQKRFPIKESQQPLPLEPFAVSKLAAEHLTASYASLYGIPYSIFRIFNAYGYDQKNRIIPNLIESVLRQHPLTLNNSSITRDYVFIDDIIKALALALYKGNGTFNISTGVETNMAKLAETIFQLLGQGVPIQESNKNSKFEIKRSCGDIAKIAKIGWKPTIALEEGLLKTISWHRKQNV